MAWLTFPSSCIVCVLYSDSCHRGASTEELNCAEKCQIIHPLNINLKLIMIFGILLHLGMAIGVIFKMS